MNPPVLRTFASNEDGRVRLPPNPFLIAFHDSAEPHPPSFLMENRIGNGGARTYSAGTLKLIMHLTSRHISRCGHSRYLKTNRFQSRKFLASLLGAIVSVASFGADEKPVSDLLTLERIFDSSEFNGESFSARWLDDSSGYTKTEDSKETKGGKDIVRYDPETGEPEVLVPAAHLVPSGGSSPLSMAAFDWAPNMSHLLIFTNTKRVWRANTRGDYWVLDRTSRELWKLGGDALPSTLMFAKFSPTGDHVAYVREKNIYVENLHDHQITQITTTDSPTIINGTFDWVYEEEFRLRDGFCWSPDGKAIAFWQLDTKGVREFPLINNTDSLYPKIQHIQYPKVGEANAACRVGVVSITGGDPRWLKVPGDPRNHYIFHMDWPEGSREIVLQQLNRLQNENRVMLANPASGKVKTILTENDAAWVDDQGPIRWLGKPKDFAWLSERDGWQHLYIASRQKREPRLVTPGEFDVIQIAHVDEENRIFYFIASPSNPTQRYLYKVRFNGNGLERVTPSDQPGTHSYEVSPNGRWAIHSYSSFETPPETDLISLPDHERIRVLADNQKLREKLKTLKLPASEFFRVNIGDGVELDAWCVKPPDFDPTQKYPLLIHVYGEPAGQTVLDRWGGKGELWHLMLAQQGYLVMSFDNRGTPAPRGRDWRKCIYRQVGVLAPQDQAAAVREVIKSRPCIDADRVGIWGWSGGGSMTLNAMFKYPDLYKTGIAIAAVPNQRLYDTIYQERYMGLPSDNVEGYKNGSPINFANALKGNLLLIHGTGDDNVHYQGAEALINELILHGKQFSTMIYPNRSHSISEGQNTTMHLRELMTSYLRANLPPGPRPH